MSKEIRKFSDLTECELNDLRQQMWDRAVKEGRELLNDVICAWRPIEECTCVRNKKEFDKE